MTDLAVEHRAALDLIYPLADALQMKLFYNASSKGVQIKGTEKMSLPIDAKGDETIPFELKAHASTVGDGEAWVLLRVRGNLWILVGYLKSNRELQLCIVDADKGRIGPVTASSLNGLTLAKAAHSIGRGIVATFYRGKDESEWRSLDDVSGPVDEGQAGEAQEGNRAADQAGESTASSS
jgi:hypothetical protein